MTRPYWMTWCELAIELEEQNAVLREDVRDLQRALLGVLFWASYKSEIARFGSDLIRARFGADALRPTLCEAGECPCKRVEERRAA